MNWITFLRNQFSKIGKAFTKKSKRKKRQQELQRKPKESDFSETVKFHQEEIKKYEDILQEAKEKISMHNKMIEEMLNAQAEEMEEEQKEEFFEDMEEEFIAYDEDAKPETEEESFRKTLQEAYDQFGSEIFNQLFYYDKEFFELDSHDIEKAIVDTYNQTKEMGEMGFNDILSMIEYKLGITDETDIPEYNPNWDVPDMDAHYRP